MVCSRNILSFWQFQQFETSKLGTNSNLMKTSECELKSHNLKTSKMKETFVIFRTLF